MRHNLARPIHRVATQLYRSLNTPRALTMELLVRHREWDQLVTMTLDPRNYLDTPSGAEKYRRDSQATDFLRKCDAVPASFDRVKSAMDSFQVSEKQCASTNYLLDCLATFGGESPIEQALIDILSKARKIVRKVMGPVPDSLAGRFGPGTSFELQGSAFSTLADKLWITPGVTQEASAVWRHTFDGTYWARRRLELGLPYQQRVRGNRFTTVPKDAKTDRGICVEPLGNLYCQLGVGGYLKERLARVGLFVNRNNTPVCPIQRLRTVPRPNGQTIHRELAEIASRDGSWATIDLSNASDTVARNLVRDLLPEEWYLLLASLRSPKTRLPDGRWVHLEKFSSMGNGFTFELETLIFAALAAAVSGLSLGEDLFVYGDDIIVPTHASADVLACLAAFGFTPNERKSFTSGPFRESCGGDYFVGYDVRGYFCKSEPSSPVEWIAMHNQLGKRFPSARHLHRTVIEQIPTRWRLFGPSRAGDLVLHSTVSRRWKSAFIDGIHFVKGVAQEPVKIPLDRWGSEFTVALALLGAQSSGLSPRGEVRGLREVSLSIS